MFGNLSKLFSAAVVITAAYLPFHNESEASSASTGYVAVGNSTSVPQGWIDFCRRYKGECDLQKGAVMDVNFTPAAMKRIKQINTWVNSNVKPLSDQDHWGVVDQWDYPTDGYGDCEDYVLLKRRTLISEGFPQSALLVTVVKDEKGEGHAVLTVKTSKGEYVLDNLQDEVLGWSQTRYRFVKRQSQNDPNVWVELGDPVAAPLVVSR